MILDLASLDSIRRIVIDNRGQLCNMSANSLKASEVEPDPRLIPMVAWPDRYRVLCYEDVPTILLK